MNGLGARAEYAQLEQRTEPLLTDLYLGGVFLHELFLENSFLCTMLLCINFSDHVFVD